MTIEKIKYNSIPGYGLMNKTAYDLRLEYFKSLSENAEYFTTSKLTLEDVQHNIESFAKLIVGFAMSLDISTCAAIASGQFAQAHEKLGRNKPKV